MSRHVVEIPGWHPARLNQWDGRHWAVRARLKKADRKTVGVYARMAGVPVAASKRRVTVLIGLKPQQRGADPDAYWKSLLDALVSAGLLVDDSPGWCELAALEYRRGEGYGTTVILDDLTPAVAEPPEKVADTTTKGSGV